MSEPFPTMREGDSPSPPQNSEGDVHPVVRYEQTEARLAWVAALLAVIAIGLALTSVVAWWFLQAHETAGDRMATESHYSVPQERLPREPRLEPLDRIEGIKSSDAYPRQFAMERILHSYGQTSDAGFVHIPVEQAIRLTVETLPVRQKPSTESGPSFGLLGGGEPNSGRLYLEAPPWFGQSQ